MQPLSRPRDTATKLRYAVVESQDNEKLQRPRDTHITCCCIIRTGRQRMPIVRTARVAAEARFSTPSFE